MNNNISTTLKNIPLLSNETGSQSNPSNNNPPRSIPASFTIPTISIPNPMYKSNSQIPAIVCKPYEISLDQPPMNVFDEAVQRLHGLTLFKIFRPNDLKGPNVGKIPAAPLLNINDVDEEGRSLLHRALAINVSHYVIEKLVGFGATIYPETWHLVMNGNGNDQDKLEVIDLLLKKGAPIDKDLTISLKEYIVSRDEINYKDLRRSCLKLINSRSHS